jgi:hypothetical protein
MAYFSKCLCMPSGLYHLPYLPMWAKILPRLGGEETQIDRANDCFGTVGDAWLGDYVMYVDFDCPRADSQVLCGLRVVLSLRQQPQHLKLSIRKQFERRLLALLRLWG